MCWLLAGGLEILMFVLPGRCYSTQTARIVGWAEFLLSVAGVILAGWGTLLAFDVNQFMFCPECSFRGQGVRERRKAGWWLKIVGQFFPLTGLYELMEKGPLRCPQCGCPVMFSKRIGSYIRYKEKKNGKS